MDQFYNSSVTSQSYDLLDLSCQSSIDSSFNYINSTTSTNSPSFQFEYASIDPSTVTVSTLDTTSYYSLNELSSSHSSTESSFNYNVTSTQSTNSDSFQFEYAPIDPSTVTVSSFDSSSYYSLNELSSSLSSSTSVVVPFHSIQSQLNSSTPIVSSTQTFVNLNESSISPCNNSTLLYNDASLFCSSFDSANQTQTQSDFLSHDGFDDGVYKYVCDKKKHGNMFELVGFNKKIEKWTVRCIGCESVMDKPSSYSLAKHLSQPTHTQLCEIEPVGQLTKRETLARMKAMPRFSFIDSVENFNCKFCKCQLYSDSDFLNQHEKKRDHFDHLPEEVQIEVHNSQLSDSKRIAKIDEIVDLFDGLIGKATQQDVDFCKMVEIYRKTPSLRLNAIYCTVCRREFDRMDPNHYIDAVLEHIATEKHQNLVLLMKAKEQQELDDLIKGITRDSIPKTPEKKIHTRIIPIEDLKYSTSTRVMEGRSFSSINDNDFRSARRLVGRDISKTTSIGRGLDSIHKDYVNYMKRDLKDRDIFVMLDESVKGGGPKLIITIGSMDEEMVRHEFLTKSLPKSPTHEVIYEAIVEALVKLWGSKGEVKRRQSQVLILVSDGAKYMLKAGRKLIKNILKEMTHVTCVTHGLSLVCQEIAKQHPKLVKFISLMKKVMCNSMARKEAFKDATNNSVCNSLIEDLFELDKKETSNLVNLSLQELLSGEFMTDQTWEHLLTESGASQIWNQIWHSVLQKTDPVTFLSDETDKDCNVDRILPPHPVNTRFGTFLVAVCYYHHYFPRTLNFIGALKKSGRNDKTIDSLKQMLLESDEIIEEINHLFDHLKLIPVLIAATEGEYLKSTETEVILQRVLTYLQNAATDEANGKNSSKYFSARKALQKFEATMQKNTGLRVLFKMAKTNKVYEYAPTSSCRIERKFSLLDYVLGNRRHFKDNNFTKFAESTFYLNKVDKQRNPSTSQV